MKTTSTVLKNTPTLRINSKSERSMNEIKFYLIKVFYYLNENLEIRIWKKWSNLLSCYILLYSRITMNTSWIIQCQPRCIVFKGRSDCHLERNEVRSQSLPFKKKAFHHMRNSNISTFLWIKNKNLLNKF